MKDKLTPKSRLNNNLRVLRAERRISQAGLADALGISPQAVFCIENGKYDPSALVALRLARYFGKKLEEVFSFVQPPTTQPLKLVHCAPCKLDI